MQQPFPSAMAIYALVSCSFLSIAFSSFCKTFNRYLIVGFWMICAHVLYKVMWVAFANQGQYEIPIPFGLAYPALLYLQARGYYQSDTVISAQKSAFLFLPLFIHLIFFALVLFNASTGSLQLLYSKIYYCATILSLLGYGIATAALYSTYKGPSTQLDILIRQLTTLCFGLVVLCFLVLYDVGATEPRIGFDVRPMVYLFLAIGFALMLRYFIKEKFNQELQSDLASANTDMGAPGDGSVRSQDRVEPALTAIVDRELKNPQLFLSPFVSLDMLAKRTSLPRHQLTLVFNQYYSQSFYQLIAAARIAYARERIVELNNTVTLDSLSYECGFNSKTSFNRYFKAYTGMTPSEYRAAYGQALYR